MTSTLAYWLWYGCRLILTFQTVDIRQEHKNQAHGRMMQTVSGKPLIHHRVVNEVMILIVMYGLWIRWCLVMFPIQSRSLSHDWLRLRLTKKMGDTQLGNTSQCQFRQIYHLRLNQPAIGCTCTWSGCVMPRYQDIKISRCQDIVCWVVASYCAVFVVIR